VRNEKGCDTCSQYLRHTADAKMEEGLTGRKRERDRFGTRVRMGREERSGRTVGLLKSLRSQVSRVPDELVPFNHHRI
jgi:hypothetical protein